MLNSFRLSAALFVVPVQTPPNTSFLNVPRWPGRGLPCYRYKQLKRIEKNQLKKTIAENKFLRRSLENQLFMEQGLEKVVPGVRWERRERQMEVRRKCIQS